MLPKKLSNGICSLNAGEDRLAFSVMMDIDLQGRVVNHEIFESVINVNERMTYTNVYKILEHNDAELKERYHDFVDVITSYSIHYTKLYDNNNAFTISAYITC